MINSSVGGASSAAADSTAAVDSTAAWARQENNRTAILKMQEGVQDTKTGRAIDSAISKMTLVGNVRFPN